MRPSRNPTHRLALTPWDRNRQQPPASRRQARAQVTPERSYRVRATNGPDWIRAQTSTVEVTTIAEWLGARDAESPSFGALYHAAVRGFAKRLVTVAMRDRALSDEIRLELNLTAQAEIGIFIDRRLNRFPRLGAQLLARFTDTLLPQSTYRALRRVVHDAIVHRAWRLGTL